MPRRARRALFTVRALVQAALWGLAVAAAMPARAAAEAAEIVHVAVPGDTLIGLGRRYLLDPAQWPQLARLNDVRDPRRLPVGQPLRIPLSLMRVEPVPAAVLAAGGRVRSGADAVAPGQALPEGSALDTGADGHVTVRLVDGTVLRLRAGSRLRVDESRRVPAADQVRSGVRLEQGRVEVQAAPARGGQPGFRIGTPQGVLAVRGTAFRVAAQPGQTLGEVLEGEVAVSGSAGRGLRVAAGFGTLIDAGGQVAPPRALLPAPEITGLPALHERPLVRLTLPPVAGAAAYRVQVARDERFDELLADVQSAAPELRIGGLPDGRYPMRLRAVDGLGLEGRDAVATLALKARPEPPLPRGPAPGTVLRGDSVVLSWAASSEAARYRLQLARDDGSATPFAAPVLDLPALTALEHNAQGLPPGAYVWRLSSIRADGDAGPFGDALRFELRALPPTPVPPAPPTVGDREIRFFWPPSQPGQRVELQVASDEAFANVVAAPVIDGDRFEWPLPAPGRYFVRLRVRDADGFVGPWSATQYVDVPNCVRDSQAACVRTDSGLLLRP